MKVKTLTEYAELVIQHRNDPDTLADLTLEIAAKYAYLSETYKVLKVKRAVFWKIKTLDENEKMREKPLSDAFVECLWDLTKDGQDDMKLGYELKALEKLMSAIKTSLVNNAIERRNS